MKHHLNTALGIVLYLIVVVLLNAAATSLFFRFDLTQNKIYTLSDASKNAVATLQEPLTIKAFFSKNMPAPYNNIEQQVRDLLEEYAHWGNEFFNYSFYSMGTEEGADPDRVSEYEAMARSYFIVPIQIEKVEKDEVKLVRAYMGLAFLHGDLLETIPAVTSADRLEFTITQTIQTLNERVSSLMNLKEDIQVKLFLSSSLYELGEILAGIPAEVEQIVARLNKIYFNRLRFSHLDPALDPALNAEAERYRIPPIQMGEQSAYAGLIVTHGEEAFGASLLLKSPSGYQVASMESMTGLIENSTKAILGIHEEIGYMAGFGTPPYRGSSGQPDAVETDLSLFYPLVSRNYTIKGLLLEKREIPESLQSLLVVSPREKLSDWALFQIDQFLMRGGSAILFLDAFDVFIDRQPGSGELSGLPFYTPRETGLEQMIEHYGVALSPSYVLDENSFVSRERNQQGGVDEVPIYFAPLIGKESFNQDLDFLKNLNGLITVNIAPLKLLSEEAEEPKAHLLFSSSDQAWDLNYDEIIRINPINAQPPRLGKKSYPLAYLLEGTFRSYFTGKSIPAKPQAAGPGPEREGEVILTEDIAVEEKFLPEGKGKLFVMGTSTILGANMLDPEGSSPNSLFLLNILDVMNDQEERAVMRVKGGGFTPIEETTPRRRTFIKTFNIAVLPALVAAVGTLVWLYWVGRKRRILGRFQNSATEPGLQKPAPRGRRKS
ncbi:MAG: Gldg family protein [Spirochaetia bacterium]